MISVKELRKNINSIKQRLALKQNDKDLNEVLILDQKLRDSSVSIRKVDSGPILEKKKKMERRMSWVDAFIMNQWLLLKSKDKNFP